MPLSQFETHIERGAAPSTFRYANFAAVSMHQLLNDGQTEPDAPLAAAEEGIKYVLAYRRRHPRSIIAHADAYFCALAIRTDREFSVLGHKLQRIQDEIEEHLHHLLAITFEHQGGRLQIKIDMHFKF